MGDAQLLITGVVLAGGLGRRMGDVDKGLQPLHGRPMVAAVIERFSPQVDELLINCNQNFDRYAAFGRRIVADQMPGFAGPLAGLQVALGAASHPLVATVPCDSPDLPKDLVHRLAAALQAAAADIAVASTDGRLHPVFCLCRRTLLPHLTDFLAGGGRQFGLWFSTLNTVEVAFDDQAAAFININTADELARHAQTLAGRERKS